MSVPSAEALLGLLVELDRIRALAVELLERSAPRLLPVPAADPQDDARTAYQLLVGARRAVIGHPAAARGLHDLLIAEGRRYAETAPSITRRCRTPCSGTSRFIAASRPPQDKSCSCPRHRRA